MLSNIGEAVYVNIEGLSQFRAIVLKKDTEYKAVDVVALDEKLQLRLVLKKVPLGRIGKKMTVPVVDKLEYIFDTCILQAARIDRAPAIVKDFDNYINEALILLDVGALPIMDYDILKKFAVRRAEDINAEGMEGYCRY